jgi:hypothetical protein
MVNSIAAREGFRKRERWQTLQIRLSKFDFRNGVNGPSEKTERRIGQMRRWQGSG